MTIFIEATKKVCDALERSAEIFKGEPSSPLGCLPDVDYSCDARPAELAASLKLDDWSDEDE